MWKSKFEATGDQWRKFEITGAQEIGRGVSGDLGGYMWERESREYFVE